VLELAEAAFDEMSLGIEVSIQWMLAGSRLVVGNDGNRALSGDGLPEVVGVISGIGDDELDWQAVDQRSSLGRIAGLAGGEDEADWTAQAAHGEMDLGGQAAGRARRAIEALAKLAPETATVRRDGRTEEVGVGKLQVGDVVVIKPNERVPADGVVTVGTSSVNQAPVTGESVPVDKRPIADAKVGLAAFESVGAESRIFAGTINGSGVLEEMVARRSDQSTMARVVKMVTEAEAQRSPRQQFTERFERIFVPAVLGVVGVMLFAWLVIDEPFAASFYRAMAVLVAASPCALAISVPSAVLSGVARAGRGGVLVKGGGPWRIWER